MNFVSIALNNMFKEFYQVKNHKWSDADIDTTFIFSYYFMIWGKFYV